MSKFIFRDLTTPSSTRLAGITCKFASIFSALVLLSILTLTTSAHAKKPVKYAKCKSDCAKACRGDCRKHYVHDKAKRQDCRDNCKDLCDEGCDDEDGAFRYSKEIEIKATGQGNLSEPVAPPPFLGKKNISQEEKTFFLNVIKLAKVELSGGTDAALSASIEKGLKKGYATLQDVDNGATPLMFAAGAGALKLTKRLLQSGADINSKMNQGGFTARDIALDAGHRQVAALLDSHGAKKNFEDWTPAARYYGGLPLVTRTGYKSTWGGEVFEFRTTDGEFPKKDKNNLEVKIRITWSSSETKYRCGQVITKRGVDIKELRARPWALKKCR